MSPMTDNPRLRTPLKSARGLGAAKDGAGHWWGQRVSAAALVPLTIWFVFGVVSHLGATQGMMVSWLRAPMNAAMLILMVLVGVYHGESGLRVVYEDYVHHHAWRVGAIVATKLVAYLIAAASIVAVLKLCFGA